MTFEEKKKLMEDLQDIMDRVAKMETHDPLWIDGKQIRSDEELYQHYKDAWTHKTKTDITDQEIGMYIEHIIIAIHGRGDEDEFTKMMYGRNGNLDQLSHEKVLEKGKRIEHALIEAAARLGGRRLPTLAEIKRRFNETGDGPD